MKIKRPESRFRGYPTETAPAQACGGSVSDQLREEPGGTGGWREKGALEMGGGAGAG